MFDNGTKDNPLFQCKLLLPPNAAVHEEVIVWSIKFFFFCILKLKLSLLLKSDEMPRKKLAKMSAALKMCKLLDEAKELNESLVPITREDWSIPHLEFDVEKEDEEHKKLGYKHKMGTSKTKREYVKTVIRKKPLK